MVREFRQKATCPLILSAMAMAPDLPAYIRGNVGDQGELASTIQMAWRTL